MKLKSLLNEAIEPSTKEIARLTGTRAEAVKDFVAKHTINIVKLLTYLGKGSLKDRREFAYALSGKPDNKYQKKLIKQFSESVVTEGKFKVDDLVYNKRTKTVGIVRLGDDKYGEVKTDADGNVDVNELEKYNPIKFKHQIKAKVAPSTEKEVNKRGLFNPFKNESVNEYSTSKTGIYVQQNASGNWKVSYNVGNMDFAKTVRDEFPTEARAMKFANASLKHHKGVKSVTKLPSLREESVNESNFKKGDTIKYKKAKLTAKILSVNKTKAFGTVYDVKWEDGKSGTVADGDSVELVESIKEAKSYDIGMGNLGNGLTVYNRAVEVNGDYPTIAHISDNGKITWRDKKLPSNIKKVIEKKAEEMKNESVNEGTKRFYQQDGIGKAKYTISFHDGREKHKDGSDFYGIKTFKNKKDLDLFRKQLRSNGYREDSGFKKESVVNEGWVLYTSTLSGLKKKVLRSFANKSTAVKALNDLLKTDKYDGLGIALSESVVNESERLDKIDILQDISVAISQTVKSHIRDIKKLPSNDRKEIESVLTFLKGKIDSIDESVNSITEGKDDYVARYGKQNTSINLKNGYKYHSEDELEKIYYALGESLKGKTTMAKDITVTFKK